MGLLQYDKDTLTQVNPRSIKSMLDLVKNNFNMKTML